MLIYKWSALTYFQPCAVLALDNVEQFPKGSNAILNDFYVDDPQTGADSVSELITIKNNLVVK